MCIDNKAPEGTEHLMGLGAKYYPKCTKLDPKPINQAMIFLRNNIWWKFIFHDAIDDDYIPGLYINSEFEPDEAHRSIEEC